MIKAIIFDLAEVYLNGFRGLQYCLEGILGVEASKIRETLYGPEFDLLMEGKVTEDEFFEKLLSRNNWSADIDELKKTVRENFTELEGTRNIIEALKEKGFKLGLLSDHAREWITYCNDKFDYHRLFDVVQYSFEVGFTKTDKKAFGTILEKLGERPEDCLFIDDRMQNVEVAKSLGINAIRFRIPEELKKDLRAFGIFIN